MINVCRAGGCAVGLLSMAGGSPGGWRPWQTAAMSGGDRIGQRPWWTLAVSGGGRCRWWPWQAAAIMWPCKGSPAAAADAGHGGRRT